MAPECFLLGPGCRLGPSADIFAWALVTWQMLSGLRPWAGLDYVGVINAVRGGGEEGGPGLLGCHQRGEDG